MKETNNVEQRPSTSLSKGARRNQILRRITVVGVIAAVITVFLLAIVCTVNV